MKTYINPNRPKKFEKYVIPVPEETKLEKAGYFLDTEDKYADLS